MLGEKAAKADVDLLGFRISQVSLYFKPHLKLMQEYF